MSSHVPVTLTSSGPHRWIGNLQSHYFPQSMQGDSPPPLSLWVSLAIEFSTIISTLVLPCCSRCLLRLHCHCPPVTHVWTLLDLNWVRSCPCGPHCSLPVPDFSQGTAGGRGRRQPLLHLERPLWGAMTNCHQVGSLSKPSAHLLGNGQGRGLFRGCRIHFLVTFSLGLDPSVNAVLANW